MQALADIRIGDVFEAPWGRYVHRGIILDGRPVLADLGNPGAFVVPSLARIGAGLEYVPAGRIEPRDVRVREVRSTENAVRPRVVQPLQGVHADAGRGPCLVDEGVSAPSSPSSNTTASESRSASTSTPSSTRIETPQSDSATASTAGHDGFPPHTPTGVARSRAPSARTTLGALRPTANTLGMARDADGAGSVGILPTVETLYWLPCPVFAEDVDLAVLGDVVVPISKAGERIATIPHAFHITSSFYGGIYCPACYARKRGRTLPLPVCAPDDALGHDNSPAPSGSGSQASLASEGALSFAPDDGDRVASRSHGSDGQVTRDGALANPPAPPLTPPRGETAAAPEAAPIDIDPEITAIAARIEGRYFNGAQERAAPPPRDERMPPQPPPPAPAAAPRRPTRPSWWNDPPQPNRAVQERADWWDERAGMMSEDKSITRAQADELAYEDMKRAFARGEIW